MKKPIGIAAGVILLLIGIVAAQSLLIKSNSKVILHDPMLYLSVGDLMLKEGHTEQALLAYNKALELDPTNKAVLNNLGYFYKDTNPLLSEDYFKKSLESDPKGETARNNLALLYNKLGKYDLAAEQLKVLTEQYPDKANYNYDLAINLANKFYYMGYDVEDLNSAIDYFKKTYNINPDFEHTLDNIKVLEEIRRELEKRWNYGYY